ncbi:TIGR02444 family protein [Legionella feeleii]|uniref:Uncharacterized conserved protein n=1 Tax=Legionella feeleii TaxID=453 RepID=A0A0W0U284_9GAMM|nr:TIGR02444 family protein [Legionella feeleii]KTD02037.1 hypothetical protein Lfee_0882 [Legionella feeleii]SPX59880.1 Uncharacterized conserved protein [Legionella feeleii]
MTQSRITGQSLLTPLDNPFWQFSLQVYRDEQVKEACLAFQQQEGLNVNLLLLCCWLAYAVEEISQSELVNACHYINDWHEKITQPLRSARLQLKQESTDEWVNPFYQQVLSDELISEAYQQHRLYQCFAAQQKTTGSKNQSLTIRYLHWLFSNKQLAIDRSLASRIEHFATRVLEKLP